MSAHIDAVSRPSRRAAWIIAIAAVPAALLVSGLAVAGGSYSAFSASTANPTSNWTAGTVAISDDDSNGAMFTVTNIKPGDSGSKCIAVTSTGSVASTIKMYRTAAVTGTLGSQLALTIDQGTGGGFTAGCSGFTSAGNLYTGTVDGFSSSYTDFASGISAFTTTGGSVTKVYKFSWSLPSTTTNTYQSATSALGFTWEAQNS